MPRVDRSNLLESTARRARGLLVVLALLLPSLATGADVYVVLSADRGHYRAAGEAAAQRLRGRSLDASILLLEEYQDRAGGRATDAVLAVGGRASVALARTGSEMYYCLAPQEIASELARLPHATGVSADPGVVSQVGLMRRVLSELDRVGVLYRSGSAVSQARIAVQRAAMPADIELVAIDLDARDVGTAADAVRGLLRRDVDVIWMTADSSVYSSAVVRLVLTESLRSRTPVMGFSSRVVRAGCLFGTSIDPAVQGRRAADMLMGQRAGLHEPAEASVAINLIVAERLSLQMPSDLIDGAQEVFREGD